ncbi:competence protein CoiA [Nostoc sp. C110]|uniref:competence protein CoiA n=1 Tax=Nostoc sp. C110 TaxID=3349876 RepID=UPI00370DB557
MPLRAFIDEQEVLAPLISDGDWEALKLQRNKQVCLPCCGADGYLRTSKQSTKHFVHKHKTGCDWKPETWQHLLAKTEILRVCQRLGYDAKTEVAGSDWRADVLATKPGKQGLIQIAFEVQWSPQTLEVTQDRQAKYKRDGIRGCWFFQRPPESDVSHDLPIFKLSLDSDNSLVVQTKNKSTPLSQFVEDLLSRRIRFCDHYQIKKTQNAKIVFFPTECWKCKKQSYIYYLENPYYTCCGEEVEDYCCEIPRRFRPEVIAAVRSFLKTDAAKKIRMGEIKTRYSKTVEDSYISFGCSWCNALFGEFYYFGEVNNAIYGDDGSNHTFWETQLTVTDSNILDYEAHWCYPENGDFCI